MTDIQNLKKKVQRQIDQIAPQLIECSDWMADHPEIGLEEFQASARLSQMLEESGAEVERGIAGLPTAFQGTIPAGKPAGATVAILAEYDALPDVGHGCGHNLIGNAAIGAGMAISLLAREGALDDLPGKVIVIGTPAEESTGGKIDLLAGGYFKDVDAAIMMHPATSDQIAARHMTVLGVTFDFHGKPAHAAFDPYQGINALDAVIQTFVNIGLLRQQVRPEARIHGVITNGGGAVNIIPAFASCRFGIRSFDVKYAQELKGKVIDCARAAATASGARLEWRDFMRPYLSYIPNDALGRVIKNNMQQLGRSVGKAEDVNASTDFGNVSQVVPTAYASFGLCAPDVGWHSKEVAAATKTELGHEVLISAAKTLAMSALDILADPELVTQAKREHQIAAENG